MRETIFIFTLLVFSTSIMAADCLSLLEKNELARDVVCKINPVEFSPTQSNVGFRAVDHKLEKLKQKSQVSRKKLKKYLKKKTIPVILGPVFDGMKRTSEVAFYMIDGHHTMSALRRFNFGKDSKQQFKAYAKVIFDARPFYFSEFWPFMMGRGFVFLKRRGEFIHPKELPKKLSELEDDPYRSLAWEVRELGCFENLDHIPFQEFRWADYLRRRVRPHDLDDALKVSISDEAEQLKLPGFKGICSLDDTDNP